jgi:acyl-CoA thioesterase YciA
MTREPTDPNRQPKGELVIRTMAMPADTNAHGDIFGGWLMAQMDLGAAILAQQVAKSRVTTVAVDGMAFHWPVRVGETVACYATLERVGRTSMTIHIEVWVQRHDSVQQCVTEAVFTYVALDSDGKPWQVKR